MVPALTVLLFCQLVGELAARLLGLPVPGPVLGMLLLFALLVARPRTETVVRGPATALLRHLSLLFVPAGVGLIRYASRVRQEWGGLVPPIPVSTAARPV